MTQSDTAELETLAQYKQRKAQYDKNHQDTANAVGEESQHASLSGDASSISSQAGGITQQDGGAGEQGNERSCHTEMLAEYGGREIVKWGPHNKKVLIDML